MNVCLHVIVNGRVQGVFFRVYTQRQAKSLGLTGWVRNRPDGSVEALVEGEKEKVDQMRQWFYQGSPGSEVTQVTATGQPVSGAYGDFEIRY